LLQLKHNWRAQKKKRGSVLIQLAKKIGADLAGLASAQKLIEKGAIEPNLMPSAQTVIVVACAHSRAALASSNLQVKQYDTISTYENVRIICDKLAKILEKEGFESLSVPAFIPIDMDNGKMGMIGAIDHRAAAMEAGIGSYGKSGLIITQKFGPRVRLGSVLTSLEVEIPYKESLNYCLKDCKECLKQCPAGAILGNGQIDKNKCSQKIFEFGLRRVIWFAKEIMETDKARRHELLKGFTIRELWQNFMTGNYYYCFQCQNVCPVGDKRK